MNTPLKTLSLVIGGAFLCVSAHAACGGGGYRSSESQQDAPQEVQRVSQSDSEKRAEEKRSKLQDLQHDIDKAQTKLNNCDGDCEKEKRKLAEAKAKYAKRAQEE